MHADGFHLPGLRDEHVARWSTIGRGDAQLRIPVLSAPGVKAIAQQLRAARQRTLSAADPARIIRAIDRAAQRLDDRTDPLRQTADALLPSLTGFAPEMCVRVVQRMASDWRAPALRTLVDTEFPSQEPGRGPPLIAHIFAGNVPGVAVTSLVRALLVRSASFGKTASGEPLLPVLFARALADIDPDLADCIAVTYWPGSDETTTRALLAEADSLVFYGGADAEAAVRRMLPASVPLIEHGPRASLGFVLRPALASPFSAARTAINAARAVAEFDQLGCVSPQAIFVETGGTVPSEQFARLLAGALERTERRLPRGQLDAATAAAIRALRAAAEFRAIAGGPTALHGPADSLAYSVIYEGEPAPVRALLHRTVQVLAVPSLESALQLVAAANTRLQTAAVAGAGIEDRHTLTDAGFTRVAAFEHAAWPRPWEAHDGRGPLRELVAPPGPPSE